MHPPQDPDRLSAKWLASVMAGLIVLTVVLSVIAAWAVFGYRDRFGGELRPVPGPRGAAVAPPTSPLEFSLFEEDGAGIGERGQADQRARLESWAWIDREAGRIQIPIEVAIELVAEQDPEQEQGR